MIIYNHVGALMLIAGLIPAFVVGWLADQLWPNANKSVAYGGLVFFPIVVGSDLIYRWNHFRERGRIRFVHPLTGGMFFFVPIWIFCGLGPAIALVVMIVTKQLN
jgi:peptidoglycan/LPS O-acetylase OafA/YrhL